MLIKRKYVWDLPENTVTEEKVFFERRKFLGAVGMFGVSAGIGSMIHSIPCIADDYLSSNTASRSVTKNPKYTVKRQLTDELLVSRYNNFYEFGSHKNIYQAAQAMKIHPWQVLIDGEEKKKTMFDIDDLLRRFQLEERIYRFRCVEAWSMTVPWIGFPLRALVEHAKPTSSAKYLRMETIADNSYMPGVRQTWYPWPYVEGLTMAEATNELAFFATGIYGKEMPKQNGAPLRLVVPWKYGFKSIKSIVKITFMASRPKTFWERVQGKEYGFWANVNPKVAHPRWSQAFEQPLGQNVKVPTMLYNGYADNVAKLYKGMEKKLGNQLFR